MMAAAVVAHMAPSIQGRGALKYVKTTPPIAPTLNANATVPSAFQEKTSCRFTRRANYLRLELLLEDAFFQVVFWVE